MQIMKLSLSRKGSVVSLKSPRQCSEIHESSRALSPSLSLSLSYWNITVIPWQMAPHFLNHAILIGEPISVFPSPDNRIPNTGDINLAIYRGRARGSTEGTKFMIFHVSASRRSLSPCRSPNKVSSHFIARLLNMSSIPHRDLYLPVST
jgi:hypothetical protein